MIKPLDSDTKPAFIARFMEDLGVISIHRDPVKRREAAHDVWESAIEDGLVGNDAIIAEVKRKIGPALDEQNK